LTKLFCEQELLKGLHDLRKPNKLGKNPTSDSQKEQARCLYS